MKQLNQNMKIYLDILNKINEKEKENDKIQTALKKEAKQLKEALGASEKCVAEMKQEVKRMEDQIAMNLMKEQVKNAGKVDIGTNTPVYPEGSRDNSKQTAELEENDKQVSNENERVNKSLSEMKKIVMDKQTAIEEMKKSCEFVDSQLKESQNEVTKMKVTVKDNKKELEVAQKKANDLGLKFKESEKVQQELRNKCATSQMEISQLLALNYQLKINYAQSALMNNTLQVARNHEGGAENKEVAKLDRPDHWSEESRKKGIQKLCYSEVKKKGSCLKTQCQFSHEVPVLEEEERT